MIEDDSGLGLDNIEGVGDLAGVTGGRWRDKIFGLSSSFWISCSILFLVDSAVIGSVFETVKVLSFSLFFRDLKESLSIVLWNNEVFSFFLNTLILSTVSSREDSLPSIVSSDLAVSISSSSSSVISSAVRCSLSSGRGAGEGGVVACNRGRLSSGAREGAANTDMLQPAQAGPHSIGLTLGSSNNEQAITAH